MVNATEYQTYFGETAPGNFTRLELLAETMIRNLFPNIPADLTDNVHEQTIKNAVLEQIRFYENNEDVLETINETGFSIGKFSFQGGSSRGSVQKVVSGNSISFVRSTPYAYQGVSGYGYC
jgi:hypothetical protein